MFNVSPNGIVTMTHGDCATVPLFINANNYDRYDPIRYKLRDGDQIYFAVMSAGTDFSESELRQIYTKDDMNIFGDVVIKFKPSDTENLLPGTYYYEVKLRMKNLDEMQEDFMETIIQRKKFILL